jgi:ketosteroid isomerase-like protein
LDAAVSTNDVEGALSHYAEDVVFLAPEQDAIVGKEAVRAWTEEFFRTYRCEETHHPIQTVVTAEMVLNRGLASGSLTPWEGGDPIPFCNKYLHVYRRARDGGLELLWGAFNPPGPGEKES